MANPFFPRDLVRLLLEAHREVRERGTRLVMNVDRLMGLPCARGLDRLPARLFARPPRRDRTLGAHLALKLLNVSLEVLGNAFFNGVRIQMSE